MILFRYAKPDKLSANPNIDLRFLQFDKISPKLFVDYARVCYPNNSENEIFEHFKLFELSVNNLKTRNFLYYLSDFGEKVLDVWNGSPVVKFESIMDWHKISREIGQAVLVTSYLAKISLEKNIKHNFFAWPTTLKTENRQLQNILNQGISENHYHLNGSAQVFPITWVTLMNKPTVITKVTHKLGTNLSPYLSYGESDNQESWNALLKEAVKIRLVLFCNLNGIKFSDDSEDLCISYSKLQRRVSALNYEYAYKDPQTKYCLDYALTKQLDLNNFGCNRILVGERKFLYDCFRASYSGKFNREQNNMFYKYLLIKHNFRAEIIQNNHLTGFRNFANYQKRKSYAIKGFSKYQKESIRTAINEVLEEQAIVSLEARIMPEKSEKKLISTIKSYDIVFEKTYNEKRLTTDKHNQPHYPYFFVLHYPKGFEKLREGENVVPRMRNQKQRENYKRCSLTTMNSLKRNEFLRKRILGIDTCSNEIGCRPEVFATEYRYLKEYNMENQQSFFSDCSNTTFFLNRTYHVGEDFLDLVDGMRAIDEVIRFLNFSHGDRLGHALALGITPKEYYQFKNFRIIVPSQDALDNFVWLYMRSNEMNIPIEPVLKQHFETKINELANRIYGDFIKQYPKTNITIDPYSLYCAWKLRGDNPVCYKKIRFAQNPPICTSYDRAKYTESNELQSLRNREEICALYYAYHYEYTVKKEGEKPHEIEVTPEYIYLVTEIQKKLQFEVASKGIMIECNPSSNCLIGTFKTYEKHPIRNFFNLHLESDYKKISNCPQISVSINTDDQGIFDTSLEYEYALMASALMSIKHKNGQICYSPAQVYEYLDCIRKMGNIQSFKNQQTYLNNRFYPIVDKTKH